MKVGVVKEFRDEYFFLSNFFPANFIWRGVEYPAGEYAFSDAKKLALENAYIHDMTKHTEKVLAAKDCKAAKGVGRAAKIDVKHWDEIKPQIMREIVHARFANDLSGQNLVGKLINTGAMLLVEGNDWGDTFWGRCKGKGFNTLGALLMEERGYWLKGDFNAR